MNLIERTPGCSEQHIHFLSSVISLTLPDFMAGYFSLPLASDLLICATCQIAVGPEQHIVDANDRHKEELERVTGFRWHGDNNPFGAEPKAHYQQFDSVYATQPLTFSCSSVPGCQKSAARAWKEHLDFLPVSSLVWAAVTLVESAEVFPFTLVYTKCLHLPPTPHSDGNRFGFLSAK